VVFRNIWVVEKKDEGRRRSVGWVERTRETHPTFFIEEPANRAA
jgi:hypothetical protein